MQRLGDTANLGRNGFDGCPFGGVVLQVLQNHAHSTFTDFRGIAIRFLHASFSQELRPPRNPVRFTVFSSRRDHRTLTLYLALTRCACRSATACGSPLTWSTALSSKLTISTRPALFLCGIQGGGGGRIVR